MSGNHRLDRLHKNGISGRVLKIDIIKHVNQLRILVYELETLIVSAISGGAAISIAIYAIIQANSSTTQAKAAITQTNIMEEEFRTSHRPWIGPDPGIVERKPLKELTFDYRNFGHLPALSLTERWNMSNNPITREQIKNNMINITKPSVTLPDQKRSFTFNLDEAMMKKAINEKSSLYFGVFIQYQYGKNLRGEYGGICEYKTNGILEIIDEWVC